MRLIKKGGQALSFFVLVLRHSSMDSFGVRSLGSAAAQGGQDTFPEHANGSPLSPDGTRASRHRGTHPITLDSLDCSTHATDKLSHSYALSVLTPLMNMSS